MSRFVVAASLALALAGPPNTSEAADSATHPAGGQPVTGTARGQQAIGTAGEQRVTGATRPRRVTRHQQPAGSKRSQRSTRERASGKSAAPRPAGMPRTLSDVHIEGEIPVPQVLFITERDQRRYRDFQHHRYLRSSTQLGQDTPFPSWVAVTSGPTIDPSKETPR